MENHLIKMLAKGAAGANKLSGLIHNPLDSVQDLVADQASELLLRQLGGGKLSSVPEQTPPEPSKQTVDRPKASDGWAKLRRSVLVVSAFKSTLRTQDDMRLPAVGAKAVQGKALSLMLSLAMSTVTTGMAAQGLHTLPVGDVAAVMQQGGGGAQTEVVVQQRGDAGSAQRFSAAQEAPQLEVAADAAGGGMASVGGLAASAAKKLLRLSSESSFIQCRCCIRNHLCVCMSPSQSKVL